MIIQIIGLIVFLFISFVGFNVKNFGFIGFDIKPDLTILALAGSLANIVRLILFAIFAQFEWQNFWKPVLIQLFKMVVAFYYTLLCLWIPFQFLDKLVFDTTRVVPLIALTISTSLIGICVYIVVCHLLDVLPQNYLWRLIMKFPGIQRILAKTQSVFTPMVDVSS